MSLLEDADRFGQMWRTSREDAGKSQDYMAKALGVSKKTVQNWENGTSAPNQLKGFEWFHVLGLQPLPYYLRVLFPEQFKDIQDDKNVESALIACIKSASPEFKRKLLYMLAGKHGSSPIGIVELITAHLHTPLRNRLNIAENVKTNYEIAERKNELILPEHVPANINALSKAIVAAKESIIRAENSYSEKFGD